MQGHLDDHECEVDQQQMILRVGQVCPCGEQIFLTAHHENKTEYDDVPESGIDFKLDFSITSQNFEDHIKRSLLHGCRTHPCGDVIQETCFFCFRFFCLFN